MNTNVANKEDAQLISKIHKEEISGGFLSSLSLSFLTKIYNSMISSNSSFCIVVKENNTIVGFISGTTNLKVFYKHFITHSFLPAVFLLLPKFLNIKKILETLLYPVKEKDLPQAELLAMAVKKDFQNQGIAKQLLEGFVEEMKKREVNEFKVLVGKELESANRFYRKNGFRYLSNIKIHGKEESIMYIYDIK